MLTAPHLPVSYGKPIFLLIVSLLIPAVTIANLTASLFCPHTEFATGTNPYSLAIGELNGDGLPDLAVANYGSSTVSVLLSDGAGGFGPKADFATRVDPQSVAIGDLNGDGLLDLAVAGFRLGVHNTVSVLLGDGTGGFGPRNDFVAGCGAFSVAIGDVNLDSKPDLVVANFYCGSVSVLLGEGTGSFGPKTDFAIGTPSENASAQSVKIGDLNGDGLPDLAVANYTSGTVVVLLGDGVGGFGTRTAFATGNGARTVATGDFNGDGLLDLAVSNYGSCTVSVLLADGTGGFRPKTDFVTGCNPWTVAVGDLNGDGVPDLATGNYDGANPSNTVSVLLGDAAGAFGPKTDLVTGSGTISVAIGDLNGDGRQDLGATNYLSNTVSVLLSCPLLSAPQDLSAPIALGLTVTPNPATADASIVFSLPTKATAWLDVVDLAGRIVQRERVGAWSVGRHTMRLGSSLGRLRPGVYLLRLWQGAETANCRFVVIR